MVKVFWVIVGRDIMDVVQCKTPRLMFVCYGGCVVVQCKNPVVMVVYYECYTM